MAWSLAYPIGKSLRSIPRSGKILGAQAVGGLESGPEWKGVVARQCRLTAAARSWVVGCLPIIPEV